LSELAPHYDGKPADMWYEEITSLSTYMRRLKFGSKTKNWRRSLYCYFVWLK